MVSVVGSPEGSRGGVGGFWGIVESLGHLRVILGRCMRTAGKVNLEVYWRVRDGLAAVGRVVESFRVHSTRVSFNFVGLSYKDIFSLSFIQLFQ